MAHLKRHLILPAVLLITGCFLPAPSLAQPDAANIPAFRTLGVGSIVATSGLLFENKGKNTGLMVDSHNLSPRYSLPDSGKLSLFRELPPSSPGESPRRVPVAEALLGKSGPLLLALIAMPDPAAPNLRNVTALAIDDSPAVHPPESVRVFNFSRRTVAVQTTSGPHELAYGASQVIPYPEKSRVIDLKIAIREKENWLLCSTSPQGIIPKTRMIIVIADDDPTTENPRPVEPVINTIYDTTLPPPQVKDTAARSSAKPTAPST